MELPDSPTFQLIIYFLFFLIATAFSIALNFLLLKVLKNTGMHGRNGHTNLVRWASQTKPPIGGISFFILFLLSVTSFFILPFGAEEAFNSQLLALMGVTSLGFVVGLVDDAYTTPPFFKFAGQMGCAAVLIALGICIPLTGYGWVDAAFTTFWVVGIMNSINMLDNMDGITASVSVGVCASALVIIYLTGQSNGFFTIVLVGVMAALVGFLYFNWHPAKAYMGDSGSQFLGAFLAFVAIVFMWQFGNGEQGGLSLQQFLIPAVVFMLPIIDTTTVVIRRKARGQSPFVGGRDHTTHHLAYAGFSDRGVALIVAAFSFLSAITTLLIILRMESWTHLLSALVIGYLLAVFLAAQYFYELGKRNKTAVESQHTAPAQTEMTRKASAGEDSN